MKESYYIERFYKVNNLNTILLFTNLGNYLFLPVRDINESKFKDVGTHISSIIKISDDEKIIKSIAVNKFDDSIVTAFSKDGMVKRINLNSFEVTRYSKPMMMFKLKDNDELISVSRYQGNEVLVVTSDGYGLKFNLNEIPTVGIKASGVKSIKLNTGAHVISGLVINDSKEYITLFTDKNTAKRIKLEEIELSTRAKKGCVIIKSPKSKTYKVTYAFNTNSKTIFGIVDGNIGYIKSSDINILDKASTGSVFTKKNVDAVFAVSKLIDTTNQKVLVEHTEEHKKEQQEEKHKKQLTMSDFFEEFKI